MKQFSLWIPLLSSVCTQPFFHAKTKVPGFCHSFISSCLTCYGLDLEKIPLLAGLWYLPYQFQSYVVLFQIAETAFCFPRFFFLLSTRNVNPWAFCCTDVPSVDWGHCYSDHPFTTSWIWAWLFLKNHGNYAWHPCSGEPNGLCQCSSF